ncbi:MAG TPA: VWA domain-containing protein, partial [Planctomycetota bacterium]|nr:VWA domain-containing protein [Planctomycetota bacterium]
MIGLLLLATTTSSFAKELSSRELSNYKRLLQNLVQGQSKPRLGELIKELAEYDDPRAYQLILPAATLIPSAKNYEAALDAIARVTSEKVIEELVETAGKRNIDLRWRVLLVDGFARRIDETTRKSLLDLVQDRDTRIVVAVIRAMSARQERDSIPALINLLEKINTSRDRVWLETRHALVKLTGQDYDAIEDWKKFAETLPADFDPKKLGEGDGLTKVNIKKVDDSVEFFGEEIYSRNLVFVIDVSGSMMMWDDSESYSGSNAENDLQRLKRAKEQLYAALGKLPKGTKFNVIAYSDKVISWKKDLQPATSASIKSATQFVSGFKAEGLTHTDDALKRA